MMKAAGGAIASLLLTTFDTAADQTFIDNQLLDTVAEGLINGTLTTIKDPTYGGVEILDGLLKLQGGATDYTKKGAVFSQPVTPVDGLAAYVTMGPTAAVNIGAYYSRSGIASVSSISGFSDLLMPVVLSPFGVALAADSVAFPSWTVGVQDGYLCLIDKTNNDGLYFYFNGIDFDLIHTTSVTWPTEFYMTVNDICNGQLDPSNKTEVGLIDIPTTLYTAQLAAAIGGQTTGFTFEGIE